VESPKQASKIWKAVCKILAETLSKDVFDRWIGVIQAKDLQDGTLHLSVANDFYHDWLEQNYLPLIEQAVHAVSGHDLAILISVDKDVQLEIPSDDAAERKSRGFRLSVKGRDAKECVGLNQKYTFDAFIVGPSNSFAHAASLAVAQTPARAYNPLFIYGGVGLGKTHLMQAIGHYVVQNKNHKISYLSSEAFMNEYVEALLKKQLVQFRRKYRHSDLLLIDDIQFLAGKDGMQEEFFHTFNDLFNNHKQIVLTCDRPASEIPGLEKRLVSRFEWGLVTQLESPDAGTRMAIIQNKLKEMKLELPGDAVEFIATRIRSNIRRLEGALIRVASYASLTRKTVSVQLLEELLRDLLDEAVQEAVTVDAIQREVARFYDLRISDILGNRRPQHIAFPRQVAMYLSRSLTDQSLPSIGEAFSRNHATVIYACRAVENRMQTDEKVRGSIATLRNRLGRQ
jgi:chromosomal replication initiator protein